MSNTESEIDRLFRDDPEKAFEYIYSNYYQMLCNRSLRITYDMSSAEDVVQEVLLELWNKKDSLSEGSSIIAYLKTSVYNRSLNFIKVKSMSFESDELLKHHINNDASPHEEVIGVETSKQIYNIIEQLPPKCRTVFALSRYEEKSYREISEDLGISVKTVENQISKALKTLRSFFD